MIDRLLSAAEIAAGNGVTLLLENQPITRSALGLWHLLDRVNHPSGRLLLEHLYRRPGGRFRQRIAVPMLNTRIRYVDLQDAKSRPIPVNLGEGDLPLRNTLNRLGAESALMVTC